MCPHLAARGAICGHVIRIFIRCKQTLYLLCASKLILVFAILVIEISVLQAMSEILKTISDWVSSLWFPTSKEQLQDAESKILKRIKRPWIGNFIRVGNDVKMWTIQVNLTPSKEPPLVLVHGFISGVCWWAQNFTDLSEERSVFAFDLPGFGRSSRPVFSSDCKEAENKFVQYIEEWRRAMGLEKIILLGHSLGGYIVTAYALKYPERIEHLLLSDPWGFAILPGGIVDRHPDSEQQYDVLPRWVHFSNFLINTCNVLSPLRVFGPLGPWIARLAQFDTNKRESELWKDKTMLEYIYHCNAQTPSGEDAFRHMNVFLMWAKSPMVKRVSELPDDIPMTIMYGSSTFFDHRTAYEIKCNRENSKVEVFIVKNAGHDIHVDNAKEFNRILKQTLEGISDEEEWTTVDN